MKIYVVPEFQGTLAEAHATAISQAQELADEFPGEYAEVGVYGPLNDKGRFPLRASAFVPPINPHQ